MTGNKVLSILSTFTINHPQQSFDQLLIESKIPQSTLYRYLKGLLSTGYIIRNTHEVYQLGPKILQLGRAAEAGYDIRNLAIPWMDWLWEKTEGKTISLWIRLNESRLCIESRERKGGGIKTSFHPGETIPIYAGAAGKVLLAFMEKSAVEKLLKKMSLKKITPMTITDRQKLSKQLSTIRKQGYCYTEGEVYQGAFATAAPLFNSRGFAEAALAISGIIEGNGRQLIKQLSIILMEVSRKISMDMGKLEKDF